jgi:hypothetical protein
MRARFVTPVGALVLGCLLAGCGSSGSSGSFDPAGQPQTPASTAPAATAPASAPPSTMTTQQINKQVLARYREYQKVYEQVYSTGDPSALTTVAVDPALTNVTKDVQQNRDKGEIWRFHNVLNPKIQGRAKDSSVVVVLDCIRTLGTYRYSAATGKRLGSWPGGATYLYQAVMRFNGGTWKISEARQGKKC